MEYFIGSIVTVATILFVGKLFSKKMEPPRRLSVNYSQSYIHEIVKPALPFLEYLKPPLETQATKFNKDLFIRIIIIDNLAYWITDNKFFVAPFEDGLVQKEYQKPVDTMTMSSVELEKMAFIVEKLTEGDAAK